MLQIVSDTLSARIHSCIEAPTGVGKTIAYFLPSVLHALSTGTQVCISTHTRTLQDQIEYKDIPKIRSLLEPFELQNFRIQKLKGRSNYASLLRSIEYIEQEKFE